MGFSDREGEKQHPENLMDSMSAEVLAVL